MSARAAVVAFALALAAGMAQPAVAETLYAAVTLNGRDLRRVLVFELGSSGLETTPQNLSAMGLKPQPQYVGAQGRVLLSMIPGLRYTLRAQDQQVDIIADPAIMAIQIINPATATAAPDRAALGGVLSYAVAATAPAGSEAGYSANLEGRAFGPLGVLSASGYARHYGGGPNATGNGFHRLDTTFIHDDPARIRQFIAGDFISGSQTWSRPVRGVGVSLRTDFSLRPELITQPMPLLHGAPSVPSTVDLYVDGLMQLSQPTEGPFQIQQPPVLTGHGEVTMVVTDLLGRQTVQTFPFYGSDSLLRPGLASYAFDLGWLRKDYASQADRYTSPFAQAMARRGISDSLTLEARGAASRGVGEIGVGAVFKLRQAAIAAFGLNLASGKAGTGGLWRASVERRTGAFSIYGQVVQTFGDYQDVAVRAGDPVIRQSVLAGMGFGFARWGSLSLNYTRQRTSLTDVGIASLSWSRPIARGGSVYISGYVSERGLRSNGVSAGVIVPFGRRGTAGAQAASGSNSNAAITAHAQEPPPERGGWGWRMRGEAGANLNALEGGVRLASRLVDASADMAANVHGLSARGFATGSVVWLAGAVPRLSSAVGQSFALVETGQANIEIAQENRVVGRTARDGRLLIPYVGAFAPTRLSIVPSTLPFELQAHQSEAIVRPPRKVGVLVKLPVAAAKAVYLRVTRSSGKPFTVGLPVLMGGRQAAVVGYDGMVWIENAAGQTTLEIPDPDGACVANIPATASGDAAHATEVTCHAR